MSQRIGLYGGSFDPIHFGHLISARGIAEQLGLDRVVLIPSARPPHKQAVPLTDPAHRLAMAALAVEEDPLYGVSDLELRRHGPSYTFDTVTEFRNMMGPDVELAWFIGGDTLPELPTWYRIAELVKIVRIVTACRPGWSPPPIDHLATAVGDEPAAQLLGDCLSTPAIDISATDIRNRVRAGKPVRYLVPDGVASYITKHALYRT